MDKVYTGFYIKEELKRKNTIIARGMYEGEEKITIDDIDEHSLYFLTNEEENEVTIVEVKRINSIKELIKFRKYINTLPDEEALNKTIVYEMVSGKTLLSYSEKNRFASLLPNYETLEVSGREINNETISSSSDYILIGDEAFPVEVVTKITE